MTETGDRNEVVLVGRLAAPPQCRVLPSGDELTVWRLVVRRAPAAGDTRAGVDTLDCSSAAAAVGRAAAGWQPGDLLEVAGALRRRFWRSPTGVASRCEVTVHRARRVREPAVRRRPGAAGRPR